MWMCDGHRLPPVRRSGLSSPLSSSSSSSLVGFRKGSADRFAHLFGKRMTSLDDIEDENNLAAEAALKSHRTKASSDHESEEKKRILFL